MDNHPDYSQSRSSLFPAYGKQQTSPSKVDMETLRQQLYDSNEHFQINTDLSQNRLKSPTNTVSYPQIKSSQLPRDGHSALKGDSKIYFRENNSRYDFQKEQDLVRSQRFSQSDQRNQSHFGAGDPLANVSHSEPHQSRDMHLDYSRGSFFSESINSYDDYNRERLSQHLASDAETRIQREQVFNRFPKEVIGYHNEFPPKYIVPPVCDYSDSSSLRSQSLNQRGLYGDIPSPGVQTRLSKEEEILKEIKALQQQQKLQELLNVSLSLAKRMKSSTVPDDFRRESLSNNTSSSLPDSFINQGVSKEMVSNEMQNAAIFPKNKPFITPQSNSNDSVIPTLEGVCDSSINISKPTELKDPPESEKVCESSESSSNTLRLGISHESSKHDCSIPLNSVNNTVLNKELNTSSTNNLISGDSSSANEWTPYHTIPFLGETGGKQTDVNKLGLKSSNLQKSEKASNFAAVHNPNDSGESTKLIKSNLEDALERLEIVDPVVGLDFIIENRSNVSVDGGFPFYCQLCNSSITRSLIIDHILSYKHRIRFVKIKDEALYEYITSNKVNQCEKEEEVYKAAEALENIYGRGCVGLQDELSTKDTNKKPSIKINFKKAHDNPKPTAFELENEIDLEQRKFSGDVNVKKANSISSDGMDISSPLEASAAIPKSLCLIPLQVKSKNEFCKQVSPVKSENTSVSFKNEPLTVTSPLKHNSNQKVTVESLLSSKYNLNDAVFSNVISTLKRPASPLETMFQKRVKNEGEKDIKSLSSNISLLKESGLGGSSSISQSASQSKGEKSSLTELLQHMTKCEISSNEEAEMISKTVDVLLKLLLCYKLQQEPSDEMEKLMKSFLNSHLEKSHGNSDMANNIEQFVENEEIILSKPHENISAPKEVKENKNSMKIDFEQSLPPQEISKTALNPDTVLQAVSTSQPSNAPWLQPPPFFCWPKSSTPLTPTTTSRPVAKVETNWSSQYVASLYAYPQQGYVGVPSMYQPYALPIGHCVAPMPMQMAVPPPVPMAPVPPPPKNTPPPLPSMKEPSLQPPPPPLPPPSGPPVLPPPPTMLPPLPPHTNLPVPPPPPSTDGPPLPPLPP